MAQPSARSCCEIVGGVVAAETGEVETVIDVCGEERNRRRGHGHDVCARAEREARYLEVWNSLIGRLSN